MDSLHCYKIVWQDQSLRLGVFAMLWRLIRLVYSMSYSESELYGILFVAILGCGPTSKLGAIILVTTNPNHDDGK